jgi:hypothetical protein
VFDLLASLAAMFARKPPSSSDPAERKALFRHLLLQIGGANLENPPIPTRAVSNTTAQ